MLALGITSAAVLVAAAWAPGTDPRAGARTALAQLAVNTEQAVVATWKAMLDDPAPIAPACSPIVRAPSPTALLVAGESEPQGAANVDDAACEALLAEAELHAWRDGDFAGAEELAADATTKRPSVRQRATLLRLRGQLAIQRGDDATLRELVEESFDLSLDTPVCDAELCELWLAAAKHDPARQVLDANLMPVDLRMRRLLNAWNHASPPVVVRRTEPRTWYSFEGLEGLAAFCERMHDLPPYYALAPLESDALGQAAVLGLDRLVGTWPRGPWSTHWNLLAIGEDFLAQAGEPNGPWTGFFVARADLRTTIEQRLRAQELLPEGVALDFDGGREELGGALGERVALSGAALGFTLRHRDPDELVRTQERRLVWLRGGLCLLALLSAGAGIATWSALRRERRLAELRTTFVANVSHELRTPLASILLLAENLESGRTKDPSAQARYHALIRREALRLSHLVDDVLDFSRLERGKPLELRREELDPRRVIDEWCVEMRAWAGEHEMELALEIGALPESFSIDREALRRALFNLLDNARKHSGSRNVRFSAMLEPDAGSDSARLTLQVADQGRGIPVQQRGTVFEPFERLREGGDSAPGAGLGLAIVKEIVLAHGGTIRVEDPPSGTGCVFRLRLPVSPMSATHETASREVLP